MLLANTSLDLGTLSVAINDFSFSLYKALNKSEENIIFSPFSVQLVLFLTSIGAKGRTYDEIINTTRLPFALNQQPDVLRLYKNLSSEIDTYPDYLKLTTGIFVENSRELRSDFVSTIRNNVNASVESLDLKNNSSGARDYLNDWAAKRTDGKIRNSFPTGSVGVSTNLILANAFYFKSPWAYPFDAKSVHDEPFYHTPTDFVRVKTMHVSNFFGYYEDDYVLRYSALKLHFNDWKFNMIVLLPHARDGLADLEANLHQIRIPEIEYNMFTHDVNVSLPKFKIEHSVDLKSALSSMGCSTMFSDSADFSNISESDNFTVDNVLHKAVIDLNENGAGAALSEGSIETPRSKRDRYHEPPRADFVANHPFIFAITYERNVLFLGRVKKF